MFRFQQLKKFQITNHNDRNSKSQTIGFWSYLRFGYCNLLFPIYAWLDICSSNLGMDSWSVESTFSERSLGKSLVPIYWNHIIFAHDLCHSRKEYFSLRLVDPTARGGMLSLLIEKTERSLRLVGVVAPTPRRAIPQIFPPPADQYSIPACPG